MNLRTKIATTVTATTLAAGIVAAPMSAGAAPAPTKGHGVTQTASRALPVTGTLSDGRAFTGQLSKLHVAKENGKVVMRGVVTGTGLPTEGTPFWAEVQGGKADKKRGPGGPRMAAAPAAGPSCQVLNLDLGPLNLDLLGLKVDLAPVALDITAVPGAGNLLGNLLCSVAGLLDQGSGLSNALGGITTLLNKLLGGLGLAA